MTKKSRIFVQGFVVVGLMLGAVIYQQQREKPLDLSHITTQRPTATDTAIAEPVVALATVEATGMPSTSGPVPWEQWRKEPTESEVAAEMLMLSQEGREIKNARQVAYGIAKDKLAKAWQDGPGVEMAKLEQKEEAAKQTAAIAADVHHPSHKTRWYEVVLGLLFEAIFVFVVLGTFYYIMSFFQGGDVLSTTRTYDRTGNLVTMSQSTIRLPFRAEPLPMSFLVHTCYVFIPGCYYFGTYILGPLLLMNLPGWRGWYEVGMNLIHKAVG